MKNLIPAIAIVMTMATPVYAGSSNQNSESQSQSQSSSGIYMEGSNVTPSMGGFGGNSTAPCVIGRGAGVGVPGAGVGFSTGTLERNCNTREEAKFIANLLNMPNGIAKTAAIHAACSQDESIRKTLVAVGVCRVVKKTSARSRVER